MLYARNLIDKTRNLHSELQHTRRAIDYSSTQAGEAEKVIDQTLEVLKFLKGKYQLGTYKPNARVIA